MLYSPLNTGIVYKSLLYYIYKEQENNGAENAKDTINSQNRRWYFKAPYKN